MNDPIGLYLHIPFCASKCPYCDFYSLRSKDPAAMERYAHSLEQTIREQGEKLGRSADTIYFGGGTPSVLPPKAFQSLLCAAQEAFPWDGVLEITVECNPSSDLETFLPAAVDSGVDRVSLGMQSAVTGERRALGRRADRERITSCVRLARSLGVDNISVDVMLGVPGQTSRSLDETLSFLLDLGVPHVSAYLLKLEEGTNFYRRRNTLDLPEEDLVCDLYLQTAETLESAGILPYEISNFAVPGFESRHNLKYWHGEEYLGLGPTAHSYLSGRRFFYPRDIESFQNGIPPVDDGPGGSFAETFLLALRLTEGYRGPVPDEVLRRAKNPALSPYLTVDEQGIRLTREGFLVSNTIITDLLLEYDES